MKCITQAWDQHEAELRGFLRTKIHDHHLAEDLLQDVFIKAVSEGKSFCNLSNTRAWLFKVLRNRLIDYRRTHKDHEEVEGDYHQQKEVKDPVIYLSHCLPLALNSLSEEDKEIIELCDLGDMNQAQYATLKHLSTAGAKSRIQRARKRLKSELQATCKIVFDDQGNVCCINSTC